jgi:hypothetical protein
MIKTLENENSESVGVRSPFVAGLYSSRENGVSIGNAFGKGGIQRFGRFGTFTVTRHQQIY